MTTVLFDFDGTLADSLSTILEITNRLAPEFGYRPTPLTEVDTLKGLNIRQLIRYSGLPVHKIPGLLRRLRSELQAHQNQIPPCSGIPAAIRYLHAQNYQLAIITSNTPQVVHAFLAAHGLGDCFIDVEGGGTLFGKGRLIRQWLERHPVDLDTTVYVGDEVRDIQAARFAGIRPVSITWGFNSREALAAAHPDWLVDDPHELSAIAALLSG